MSYLVFARKFRPQQLENLVGQDHIVTTLTNAFAQARLAQSFLFVGSRGVGKTTTARIVAKALNCQNKKGLKPHESCGTCVSCTEIANGSGMDVLEIDGASNNSVDNIRELCENVKFKPMHGAYRIYIIDEVHMLSTGAFNALLKTLEEPPAHVKFIFATTEVHKIPPTILSRCQRYDFRLIATDVIAATLRTIATSEKLAVDDKTIYLVAKNAEGSLRDAETLFDKVASALAGNISYDAVLALLGVTDTTVYYELLEKIVSRNVDEIVAIIADQEEHGKDLMQFSRGFVEVLRDMLMARTVKGARKFVQVSNDEYAVIERLAKTVSEKELLYFFSAINNAYRGIRSAVSPKIELETVCMRLAMREDIKQLSEVVTAVDALRKKMATEPHAYHAAGAPALKPASPRPAVITQAIPPVQKAAVPVPTERPVKTQPAPVPAVAAPVMSAQSRAAISADTPMIDRVYILWNDIVGAIKREAMATGSFLATGKAAKYDQGRLTIAFGTAQKLNKESVEKEKNRLLIERHFSAALGEPVTIQFVINDALAQQGEVERRDKAPEQMDDMVKATLNMFQGRVVQQ